MALVQLIRASVLGLCLVGGVAAAATGPQYRNLESVGLRRLADGSFEVTKTSSYKNWLKGIWEGQTGQGGSRELVRYGDGKLRLGGGQASDVPFRMKMKGPAKGGASAMKFGKWAFKNGGKALLGPAGQLLTAAQLLGWIWDEVNQRWEAPQEGMEGYEATGERWCVSPSSIRVSQDCREGNLEFGSPRAAAEAMRDVCIAEMGASGCGPVEVREGEWGIAWTFWSDQPLGMWRSPSKSSGGTCPAGSYFIDGSCMEELPKVPVPEPDFLEEVPSDDITPDVANDLEDEPDLDWLNQLPEISPTWLPMSDPIPNPQHDPEYLPANDPEGLERFKLPWLQPGLMVSPANTPMEPWRIQIQPWDIYVDDPAGMRSPVPRPWPDGQPWTPPEWWKWPFPDPFGGEQGAPAEGSKGGDTPYPVLCDIYPDISACQVLGDPGPEEDLPDKEVQLQVDPDTGWGEGGGSCPEPIVISVMATEYAISWDPICTFAVRIRGLVIALAWFTAALMFFGFDRSGN